VIESNKILKEYMEVKEEAGKRKLTGRCRLGRQLHEGVVVGAGSSRSGRGRRRQHLGQATIGPSSMPPLRLPPARGTIAPR
jgi:hypothetical protein